MIGRFQKAAALVSMLALWRNFGDRPVLINPHGPHWAPLRDAERMGWAKWSGERCWLTPAGVEELIPYGVKVEAVLMEAAE